MADASMLSKLTAEAVGTSVLIFTVGCNVLSGNAVWGGVSIASALMVAIYALGGISGANFNPAVSLSLGLTKAMKGPGLEWKDVGLYMVAQIVAGIAVAFGYTFMFSESFKLGPATGFRGWQAGMCEFLYTFMLCFVVLNVAAIEKAEKKGNEFYGLAIGFVIVAGAYGAGAISGGCFNPAVAIAIEASSGLASGFWWLYILAELAGAAFAAALFRVVRPEEFGADKSPVAAIVSEFIGTFVLVLTVGLNVLSKSPAGAYSIAASLMCMIYALGDVSGAHFNPAVTVAITVFKSVKEPQELNPGEVGKFIVAQLCGGSLGAVAYSLIHKGGSFPLGPGVGFGWAAVFVAEAVFTFVLCYVVLCVAVSKKTSSATMFGLAIGACVTVGGNAIGAISGGSLNPAVSLGISLTSGSWLAAALYVVFELVGATLAAGVFMVTHEVVMIKDPDAETKQDV